MHAVPTSGTLSRVPQATIRRRCYQPRPVAPARRCAVVCYIPVTFMENPANAGPATRVAAALALLVAGAGGVAAPLLHRAPDGPGGWASSLSSFSAGVMLSLALLHLLADAQTLLLGVSPFPLAGLFAGVGILSSLAVDALNSDVSHALDGAPPAAHHAGSDAEEACGDAGGDAPASSILHETAKPHAHAHDAYPLLAAPGAKKLATAHLLEGSILVHSLVIGLNLGAAPGTVTSVSAFAAVLCVHQLFEGASLGSVLAGLGATVPHKRKLVLAGAFAAATPAGVLAGVITKMDVADSPLLAGALNGVTGGMLLHLSLGMAATELAGATRRGARAELFGLLLLGAALMALLAFWA